MSFKKYKRVIILCGLLIVVLLIVEGFARAQDAARRASCRPQIIYQECTRFAEQHGGLFPPLSPIAGMLFPDLISSLPFLMTGSDNLCEFDADRRKDPAVWDAIRKQPFNDWSYVYLGFAIESEEQLLAFAEAYRKHLLEGKLFEGDLAVAPGQGTRGGDDLLRLRTAESLAKAAGGEIDPALIPVVIEWPENHRYPGGHVVYLDGHSEYVLYPGKFPMTPACISALRSLDNFAPRVFGAMPAYYEVEGGKAEYRPEASE